MLQQHCPLLFTFTDKVEGNGYLAEVVSHGRALACFEAEGEVWMYGVNPGGLAAQGEDGNEAYLEFRKEYATILFDIAGQASSFEEFKAEVERFFSETSTATETEWHAAVEAVRAGKVTADGLEKKPAESARYVEVKLKTQFSAANNVFAVARAIAA